MPLISGPVKVPAGQRHNAAPTLRGLAEIEWLSHTGLETVDRRQEGSGSCNKLAGVLVGSLGCGSSGVTLTLHPIAKR